MAQLHELLAAEKSVNASWHTLLADTLGKFKKPHMFEGMVKTLSMLEDTPANKALEEASKEEKTMQTTVVDTLDYALGIFAKAEDLQAQKNATNAQARGTVMINGVAFLENLPVDELLGLEDRLSKIRNMIIEAPTLDASKSWARYPEDPKHVRRTALPEIKIKTETVMVPVTMAKATDKHPEQVKESSKVNVVGKFTEIKMTGAVSASQKANAIVAIDNLIVEVKQARMRANMTEVVDVKVGKKIADYILASFKE